MKLKIVSYHFAVILVYAILRYKAEGYYFNDLFSKISFANQNGRM